MPLRVVGMVGGSSEYVNGLLRAFMRARHGRDLTPSERAIYQRLLREYNAATQLERLCREDVTEVA